jgi:hypothetical protein
VSKNPLTSFDGFPKEIHGALHITPFKGSLMILHEKYHDQKSIEELIMYDCLNVSGMVIDVGTLAEAFEEISDPFEFQDWCINNGYEEYL